MTINYKLLKVSKRVAIILLIAVFSIGFISCKNKSTQPSNSQQSADIPNGGNNGAVTPEDPNTPEKPQEVFPPYTYYRIRAPFAVAGDGYAYISYRDTNGLNQLWFDQLNRKAANDGKVFAIRNKFNNLESNSFQIKQTHGKYSAYDYYYFNENGDIVWKEDNTVIKKFAGAVMVNYRYVAKKEFGGGENGAAIVRYTWGQRDVYTVGGIYAMTMSTEDAREKYLNRKRGEKPFANGDDPYKDGVFDFIAARHPQEYYNNGFEYKNYLFERQYTPGFIEVLVMNEYDNWNLPGSATVYSYYAYYGVHDITQPFNGAKGFTPENMPFMTNPNVYLGQPPQYIMSQLNHSAAFSDWERNWRFLFQPGNRDVDTIGRKASTSKVPTQIPRW